MEQMTHHAPIVTCIVLANKWRDRHGKAHSRKVDKQKERTTQRHCGKGHSILATMVSHHGSIGKLRS